MASVLWDVKGMILIDHLKKEKNVTTEYCASLLDRLKTAIVEKRPGMAMKKVLFHYNNALDYSSHIAQQKLTEVRFERLPNLAYTQLRLLFYKSNQVT